MAVEGAVAADIADMLIEANADEAPPAGEQLADDETADLETMQLELAAIEAKLAAAKEEAAEKLEATQAGDDDADHDPFTFESQRQCIALVFVLVNVCANL